MKNWALFCVLFLIVFCVTHNGAASIPNAPHRQVNNVSCEDCHTDALPGTDRSAICLGCHDGTVVENPLAMGHSAAVIHEGEDPLTWPHGNWETVCLDCHDPHLHFQFSYLGANLDDLYLITAVIDAVSIDQQAGTSSITYSSASVRSGWNLPPHVDNGDWGAKSGPGRGLVFVANRDNPGHTFEIVSATDSMVILNEVIDPELQAILIDPENPTTFGVVYGQYIRSRISTPSSGERGVKFFDPAGGFVDGNNDSAPGGLIDASVTTTPEGICQVCHTETAYWKNDGTGVPHPDDGNERCSSCHSHATGFAASCEACHGYPPGVLAWNPGSTNSLTAGAHDFHVSVLGFGCQDCHYSSVGSGSTHNSNLTVTMGFSSFEGAVQGGDYVGQAAVSYDATSTSPATTVLTPATDTKTCANLYCHGNYSGSGKNATPIWDNSATGDCGTCHGASNSEPPTLVSKMNDGGHRRHASHEEDWSWMTWPRELACTTCHKDIIGGSGPDNYTVADQERHVNSYVDWQFDTTDARISPSAVYSDPSGTMPPSDGARPFSTCTNVYCHSDVQPDGGIGDPTAYDTVQWNDGPGSFGPYCAGCHNQADYYHGDGIDTGSHATHVRFYYFGIDLSFEWSVEKCTICHKWNPAADRGSCAQQCHDAFEKVYHVNGDVDVLFDSFASESATYTGTVTPGDGYGSCNNLYCHSNGTSVTTGVIPANSTQPWGSPALACNGCHTYPPDYESGIPKANSHGTHDSYSCEICHYNTTTTGTTITNTQNHVNSAYDVLPAGPGVDFIYTYNAAGSSCAAIACHAINPDANW